MLEKRKGAQILGKGFNKKIKREDKRKRKLEMINKFKKTKGI